FLPAYGFAVYPFGFVILTCLHIGTAFGSIRYRLIEITPQFAAERILTTMSDGLLVVDRSNQVRLTNAAVAELFGHSVEEMLNRRLDEVVDHHELLELLQGAEPKTAREVQFIDHHGENRFVRFYRSALVDQVGSRVADLWILHDLTAQRVAEAEKDELSGWVRETQKFQTLGVMAGGIAHDFNNILLAILGNAELISGKLDPNSPLQTQLAAIVTASQRATDLTTQLLTYAGHGTSLRTPIDLNPLVRELSELMRAAISKKIILTLDLAGDLPRVRGDSGQLSQVILNLISNASEAIGDQTGTIVVRTARSGGTRAEPPFLDGESETDPVLLEVRDSGAGMDAETRDKAFDPFFSTKLNGRGLGLATVLGIVRGHGGQIRVDSEPGRGSTFSIVLPGTNALAAPRNVEPVPQELVGDGVALVADDEAQIRDLLSHFLRDRGFDVIQAEDGEQALSHFRDRSRDIKVVLLDVSMPGLGGFEVLQAIRVEAPSTPIVLMTGYSDVSQAALAPDPYCAFLGKPFVISQLSDAIRLAMAGDSGPSRRPMD
ncbi:MAG: response regulator, partial [Myxococcales bacterium]|nr:response regulator [Myxococcales bacterium]